MIALAFFDANLNDEDAAKTASEDNIDISEQRANNLVSAALSGKYGDAVVPVQKVAPIFAAPGEPVDTGDSSEAEEPSFVYKPADPAPLNQYSTLPYQPTEQTVPRSIRVTEDHQRLILVGLLKSSYLLSLVLKDLNESYFDDVSCRVIYKALSAFYSAKQKIPTKEELMVAIENKYINLGKTVEEIKTTAKELLAAKVPSEEFVIEKSSTFIRNVRTKRTLQKSLERIRSGDEIEDTEIADSLTEATKYTLETNKMFTLNDVKMLSEVRAEALGDGKQGVISSVFPSLNDALMYKGYQFGTLNLLVAPPARGKTSILVNEGAFAVKQGFHVAHIFLGDMIMWDGFIRYMSCILHKKQRELVAMPEADLAKLITGYDEDRYGNVFEKIHIMSYAAGEKRVDEVIEAIKKQQENLKHHFSMVIIDYADNFRRENMDNMYLEGGTTYDKLALFARSNHSVVNIATQPKQAYWSSEIMPMEAAGESSRKQHIVDLQLCYNTAGKKANFGTFNIAKMRRGTSGVIFRAGTEWEYCKIAEIEEPEYRQRCADMGINPAVQG